MIERATDAAIVLFLFIWGAALAWGPVSVLAALGIKLAPTIVSVFGSARPAVFRLSWPYALGRVALHIAAFTTLFLAIRPAINVPDTGSPVLVFVPTLNSALATLELHAMVRIASRFENPRLGARASLARAIMVCMTLGSIVLFCLYPFTWILTAVASGALTIAIARGLLGEFRAWTGAPDRA